MICHLRKLKDWSVEQHHTNYHEDRDNGKYKAEALLVFWVEKHVRILAYMATYGKKDTTRSFWYTPLGILGVFVLMIVLTQAAYGMYRKDREAVNAKNLSEEKYQELTLKREELAEELAKLDTEEGIDQAVRDRFDVAREGEGVVVIVDDQSSTITEKKSALASTAGFFGFFKNLFDGRE